MLDVSRSDLTAGVAGAGTMGRGIAQVLAQCGVHTLLYDAQPGAAQRGLDSIAQACAKLAEIVGERCILASNTSSLSVTAMAAVCKRPGRVAVYHFFNPVPLMNIVEVVDGVLTEPWVTAALSALAKRFGHTPV